jgi:hypothetical protein
MSIHDLAARFPDVRTIRSRSIASATLDAILSEEWSSRWYSFDLTWGEREQLGSMRNGSGDEYSIVFAQSGVFVRGFDHESEMSPYKRKPNSLWTGLVEQIPETFLDLVNEPAFSAQSGVPLMTICLWRNYSDDAWSCGDVAYPSDNTDVDGSGWLFAQLLDGSPQGYSEFASQYFGLNLELSDIAAVYLGEPLTREQVRRMNPERNWDELVEELEQMGYPADPQWNG